MFTEDWLNKTMNRADMLGISYIRMECTSGYVYVFKYEDDALVDFKTKATPGTDTKFIVYIDDQVKYINSMDVNKNLNILMQKLSSTVVVCGGANLASVSSMFYQCYISVLDLSNLKPINLQNVSYLFKRAIIDELIIGDIDLSQVNQAQGMFRECKIIDKCVGFENIEFNKHMLSEIYHMFYMFKYSTEGSIFSLNNLGFSLYDLMTDHNMFMDAEFDTLDISKLDCEPNCEFIDLDAMEELFRCVKSVNKILVNKSQVDEVKRCSQMYGVDCEIYVV